MLPGRKSATLDRYLTLQLMLAFGVMAVVFACIGIFGQAARLLAQPQWWSIGPAPLLRICLALVPALAGAILPAAFLAAGITTIARLNADLELLAVFSAGLSPLRLLRPLLLCAAVAAASTALATLYGEPWGHRSIRRQLIDAEALGAARAVRSGTLDSLVPGFSSIALPGTRKGLVLALERPENSRRIVIAEDARATIDPGPPLLHLHLSAGTVLEARSDGMYQRTRFDTMDLVVPVRLRSKRLELVHLYPHELEARISDAEQSNRPSAVEKLALEKKRAYPIACFVFALLALPLGVWSGKQPRVRGFLIAVVLLLAYYLMIRFVDAFARDGVLPARGSAWIPNLVLTATAILLLWRRVRRCG